MLALSFLSYAANPLVLSTDTDLTVPDVSRQSFSDAITLDLPDCWISTLVTSSGGMSLSPLMRWLSSMVGDTFCGGVPATPGGSGASLLVPIAGGGGGGGGGGRSRGIWMRSSG